MPRAAASQPAMADPPWNRRMLLQSPFHCSVGPCIERLSDNGFPDVAALNRLRRMRVEADPESGLGRLQFAAAPAQPSGAAAYERRVYADGEVPTRPSNWHDLFNALVWLSFPRTKSAINRLHVAELRGAPGAGPRGRLRDQATLFDEGGMIVACDEPRLAALLRDFEWRQLFVEQRAHVVRGMRFFIFGHALLEKALRPYKAMAARALTVPVDGEFFRRPLTAQIERLDRVAAKLAEERSLFASREAVTPVPVMGIPLWTGDNESPAYYDDRSVFRPRGP